MQMSSFASAAALSAFAPLASAPLASAPLAPAGSPLVVFPAVCPAPRNVPVCAHLRWQPPGYDYAEACNLDANLTRLLKLPPPLKPPEGCQDLNATAEHADEECDEWKAQGPLALLLWVLVSLYMFYGMAVGVCSLERHCLVGPALPILRVGCLRPDVAALCAYLPTVCEEFMVPALNVCCDRFSIPGHVAGSNQAWNVDPVLTQAAFASIGQPTPEMLQRPDLRRPRLVHRRHAACRRLQRSRADIRSNLHFYQEVDRRRWHRDWLSPIQHPLHHGDECTRSRRDDAKHLAHRARGYLLAALSRPICCCDGG